MLEHVYVQPDLCLFPHIHVEHYYIEAYDNQAMTTRFEKVIN